MDRAILHCDCNSYFASVESVGHPELKTVPMAVCGDPESRHGIILAKNELAKKFGVATAETVWQAQRKCPSLVLVRAHHGLYEEYCERINAVYRQYTDLVEPFSIDESWLDVTGSERLFGDGAHIADELRRRIKEEIGVTISVGVSFNKIYAKLGSDYKKPDATTVISRENYKSLLFPLPVRDMIFVGGSSAQRLEQCGITTIGGIVEAGRERMVKLFGKTGGTLWENAAGEDQSPVRRWDDRDPPKSVGNGITFPRDLCGDDEVRCGLLPLCDQVGTRLRRHKLRCGTVTVQIKDPQFLTISRQRALAEPTDSTRVIYDTACEIVERCWTRGAPIRLLTVTVSNLTDRRQEQMSLFEGEKNNGELDRAVDALRQKYGAGAVSYGSLVKKDDKRKK